MLITPFLFITVSLSNAYHSISFPACTVGAPMHQPVRRDHAALLQHSHLQKFGGILQRRRNHVHRRSGLRRQCPLYRLDILTGE